MNVCITDVRPMTIKVAGLGEDEIDTQVYLIDLEGNAQSILVTLENSDGKQVWKSWDWSIESVSLQEVCKAVLQHWFEYEKYKNQKEEITEEILPF